MQQCPNCNAGVGRNEQYCPECNTSLGGAASDRAMTDGGNRRGGNQPNQGGQQRGGQQPTQGGRQQGGQQGGRQQGGQQPGQGPRGGRGGGQAAQGGRGAVGGGGHGNWDGTGYPRTPTRNDTDVVGSRIVAQIVDQIVGFVLFFATTIVFGIIGSGVGGSSGGGIASLGIILGLVVFLGYFFALEGLWDGYTVGKKVFGIKVVKEDGSECGVAASLIRNVLRIIDGLFYYVVGFILMAMSDTRQRLGDRIAGTVVVTDTPN